MISYKQHPQTAQGTPACPEKWFPAPSASDRRPEEHYSKHLIDVSCCEIHYVTHVVSAHKESYCIVMV